MSRDNLPPGVLPQDIDGPPMPRCARCSEEVNELNDVGLCEDCESEAETECKRCGNQYELRDGEETTEFCDHCAHVVVKELQTEVRTLRHQNAEAWRRGMTHAAEIVGKGATFWGPNNWELLRKKVDEIIAARDIKL